MSTTGEYLTIKAAARWLGVSGPAMRRRLHSGDLATFTNPRDKRARLVRLADLEEYAIPKPTGGGIGTEPRPP